MGDARMLDSVSALSVDELERPAGGSFDAGPRAFASRTAANDPSQAAQHQSGSRAGARMSDVIRFSGEGAVRKRLGEVAGLGEIFGGLDAEALGRPLSYVNFAGETWTSVLEDLLRHVVNHSTYRRGQVAFLLRQLDRKALGTDYLLCFDLGAGRAADETA